MSRSWIQPAGRLALVLGVAVGTVLLAVWFSGAALPLALGDPGALPRWGTPVLSVLRNLLAAGVVGGLVLATGILPRKATDARGRGPQVDVDGRAYPLALQLSGWFAVAWTLVNVAHLVLTYSRSGRTPLDDPTFLDQLAAFATEVTLGRSLLWTIGITACVAVLALAVSSPSGAAVTLVLAVSAFAFQSATGHASQNSSHELALSALFLHLLGAAVWVGTLLVLAMLAGRLGKDAASAVRRFSVIAGWCLAAVAVSGIVSAILRVGSLEAVTSRYGILVLAKVVLTGVLGLLGLTHRLAVIRRLEAGGKVRALLWRLVAVELAVMGAVSGVASGLASTATPVPDEPPPSPTPAQAVMGHALPPKPDTWDWVTQWRWDVLVTFGAVAAIIVYVRWVLRLRARGDSWPWPRTVSWVVGMLVLVWTGSGGPAMYGHVLFSAHMVQHMILVMIIPLFLVMAAPLTLAMRALPTRHDGSRGPREWLLTIVHSRYGQFFAHPVVAAVNFAGSMIIFYYSPAFELAMRTYVGSLAMTLHFLLAGYFFANGLVGIDPGPNRIGYPQRILLLFATMAFHAFFGVALMSGDLLLAPDWFGLLGRDWGPSAIEDQQRGGAVTWGIGEIPVLVLAIIVATSWSRDDERAARQRDRRVDRSGDSELEDYNAMLEKLSKG